MRRLFLLFLLLAGVSHARQHDFYNEDALRLELSDVKHDLHSARIEITLLEERIAKQERLIASLKGAASTSVDAKLASIEKMLDKALNDLRHLNGQTTLALTKVHDLEHLCSSHEKKFADLSTLKGTLTSISKAIGQGTKTYTVKAGDSLEKIARAHQTTVEEIKKRNGLTKDTILLGQEIKLD
jgi:LysM repeat protein